MDELHIDELLNDIEALVQFALRSIDLDNSNFAKKIRIQLVGEDIVISMPDYGVFIDQGRKKGGKMPPIKAMIDFIRSRRIQSSLTEEQLAWAIAKSIQRDGIKPRPFIEKLTEQVSDLVAIHINEEINKQLSNTFNRR